MAKGENVLLADTHQVTVGNSSFDGIHLRDYLQALTARIRGEVSRPATLVEYRRIAREPAPCPRRSKGKAGPRGNGAPDFGAADTPDHRSGRNRGFLV